MAGLVNDTLTAQRMLQDLRTGYGISGKLMQEDTYQESDAFRLFSFKVQPCPVKTTHPWEHCCFAHPHENARRRDPRKFVYLAEPCPDYKRGICLLGTQCPYAHGVYERNLHPSKYRTQLCTEGPRCSRRVCFFAHSATQLRAPTYVWSAEQADWTRHTLLDEIMNDPNRPQGLREQAAAALALGGSGAPKGNMGSGKGPRQSRLNDSPSGTFSPISVTEGLGGSFGSTRAQQYPMDQARAAGLMLLQQAEIEQQRQDAAYSARQLDPREAPHSQPLPHHEMPLLQMSPEQRMRNNSSVTDYASHASTSTDPLRGLRTPRRTPRGSIDLSPLSTPSLGTISHSTRSLTPVGQASAASSQEAQRTSSGGAQATPDPLFCPPVEPHPIDFASPKGPVSPGGKRFGQSSVQTGDIQKRFEELLANRAMHHALPYPQSSSLGAASHHALAGQDAAAVLGQGGRASSFDQAAMHPPHQATSRPLAVDPLGDSEGPRMSMAMRRQLGIAPQRSTLKPAIATSAAALQALLRTAELMGSQGGMDNPSGDALGALAQGANPYPPCPLGDPQSFAAAHEALQKARAYAMLPQQMQPYQEMLELQHAPLQPPPPPPLPGPVEYQSAQSILSPRDLEQLRTHLASQRDTPRGPEPGGMRVATPQAAPAQASFVLNPFQGLSLSPQLTRVPSANSLSRSGSRCSAEGRILPNDREPSLSES